MTFIITSPCVDLMDRSCIDVCPVDCIYEAEELNQLVINPEECIDCAACEPVCPVTAIFAEEDVPSEEDKFIDINYKFFDMER
ncbi:MAG: ferredoxin family protein [Dehalococcoidia bacterium]